MAGIFGNLFDFDHDGEMSALERAVELDFLDSMMREDEASVLNDDDDDESSEMLEAVGLDLDELEYMDDDERREVLEEAGFDSDELDF